jgi:hypothetical protein
MKKGTFRRKTLTAVVIIAALSALSSCNSRSGTITLRQTEIDSLRNQIKEMVAGNLVLAKNLQTFDTLDYTESRA